MSDYRNQYKTMNVSTLKAMIQFDLERLDSAHQQGAEKTAARLHKCIGYATKKVRKIKSSIAAGGLYLDMQKVKTGCYVDQISHNYFELVDDTWIVQSEVEGEELFKAKKLKDAKVFQSNSNLETL